MTPYDLELAGLGKTYPNGTPAVIDLDLQVSKGEFVSFVGPSGCGKTTTLRMIAGFEEITSGDVVVRGRNITTLPPEQRPTSTIFQNFALFPHMTVRRNIEYGLLVKGLPAAKRRRKIERIAERLDLGSVLDQRPAGLSGGQRQRVALARGLVVEPDILLLDEPLGALDANLRKSIQQELRLLQRNVGITFVFVTHAQSEALMLSDRIVVMNRGRAEQVSAPADLYNRPRTEFVARFIGRNTILSGTVTAIGDGMAEVETTFGRLHGVPASPLTPGRQVVLSIPSEAMDVTAPGALQDGREGLDGQLRGRLLIGTAVQLSVALPNGQDVLVESHASKYPASWSSGDVMLSWDPSGSTVIPVQ
jgi:putative spermidine/putrescine transport system ATP-binding protein/spermidine/putrescine transport system ATP-binding protein